MKATTPTLFANELEHCPICHNDPCPTWLQIHVSLRRWIIDHPSEAS